MAERLKRLTASWSSESGNRFAGVSGNMAGRRQSGLTLLEVTFAILILGTSFVVLLGLQSASVGTTLRIKNSQQAMLVARRILSAIEALDISPGTGEQSGSAYEILRSFEQSADGGNRLEALSREDELLRFDVLLSITDLALPLMEGNSLKQVYLNVSWGEHRHDGIEIIYLIPEEAGEDDYPSEGYLEGGEQ